MKFVKMTAGRFMMDCIQFQKSMWRQYNLTVHKNYTFQQHTTQDCLPWDSVRYWILILCQVMTWDTYFVSGHDLGYLFCVRS